MESRFYYTLESINKNPSLFEVYTLKNLSDIICGINMGRHIFSGGIDKGFEDFTFFSRYVSNYFNQEYEGHWSRIIQNHAKDDALNLFFELLEKFKNRDRSLDTELDS